MHSFTVRGVALRALCLAFAFQAFSIHAAGTPVLPAGTEIRVSDGSLGPGWHEGRIGTGDDGCTYVFLNKKSRSGHTAVSFAGQRKLQMKRGNDWVDVPVKELNPRQPAQCRNGGDNG